MADFRDLLQSGKLIIMASGNESSCDSLTSQELTRAPQEERNRCILVGNLTRDYLQEESSNWPGLDQKLQESYLYTLGTDVFSLWSQDRYAVDTGTSMAAPIVTGAAALVKSAYPNLSPEQVRTCLLESADRNFWIGEQHVVESRKTGEGLAPNETAFDPSRYGKGVLNVRRALEYGKWLNVDSEASPEVILEELAYTEAKAAQKIQNKARQRVLKKKTLFQKQGFET
ncbi:MAG: S8 family serine peptidase [Myxococcaceae bacterium]